MLGVQKLLRQAGYEVTLEHLKEALDNDAPDPLCTSCGETGARCTKCFLEYIQRD